MILGAQDSKVGVQGLGDRIIKEIGLSTLRDRG